MFEVRAAKFWANRSVAPPFGSFGSYFTVVTSPTSEQKPIKARKCKGMRLKELDRIYSVSNACYATASAIFR
eukprot:5494686-Amphidinium_carterae.1